MVHKRRSRKRHNKKRKHNKLSLVKRMGNTGHLFTKELIRADYQIRVDADGIGVVNGYSTALANTFADVTAFEDIGQSSQYATLYRQFRIRAIRYEFYPFATQAKTNDSSAVVQNELKWFWYKYGNDGTPNPQNGDPSVYQLTPKIKVFSRKQDLLYRNPKCINTLWQSNQSTALQDGSIMKSQWLETDGAEDVKHFGLQFGLMNATPNATYELKCTKTVYFELRGQR